MRSAIIAAIAVYIATLVATAGPARADDQAFLDYIYAHGVPNHYGFVTDGDYSNRKVGEMICDMLHHGKTPADIPFLGWQQDQYKPVLIDGAQRFMCPDTLH